MGLFDNMFNLSNPGPGVDKDENKSRIKVFFEIYYTRLTNLVKLNLLYIILNLPMLVICFILVNYLNPKGFDKPLTNVFVHVLVCVLFCFPILAIGPFQAGFTFILRNYGRREHAFLISDFKDHTLKNLKQGIFIMIINFVFITAIIFQIRYFVQGTSTFDRVVTGFLSCVIATYAIMHIYVYQILITVKLKIIDIYKNALIFTILNFGKNILILLLILVMFFILSMVAKIGILAFLFITVSTTGFIINFYSYPTIKKYLIDPNS